MLQGCAHRHPAAPAGFAEALSNRLQKKHPSGCFFYARIPTYLQLSANFQEQSLWELCVAGKSESAADPAWELGWGIKYGHKKAPRRVLFLCPDFDMPPIICKFSRAKPVGAKLARDSSGPACINVGCAAVIASKLCSHRGGLCSREIGVCRRSSEGAGMGHEMRA